MLCIDQANLVERAEQVITMPDIFHTAALVLVWLRPAYDNSDATMNELSRPSRYWRSYRSYSKVLSTPAGAGVVELCRCLYWRRLWVYQELQVAREKQIMCGSKTVSWDSFEGFMLTSHPSESDIFNERMIVV